MASTRAAQHENTIAKTILIVEDDHDIGTFLVLKFIHNTLYL